MKKIMYNPQPIDISDVVLSSDLEDLIVVEKFNGFVSKNPMRLRRRRLWKK